MVKVNDLDLLLEGQMLLACGNGDCSAGELVDMLCIYGQNLYNLNLMSKGLRKFRKAVVSKR